MKYSRFIVVLFFCFNQIYSSVINIPEDIETIQGGIDLAENGDTVLVAPGTYVEHIIISEKSISLLSTQGSEFTVIDGDYSGRVVTIENCGDSLLVLSGFTITKGNVLGFGEHGGGLFCLESNLLFEDLIITDNHASETFVIVAGVLIESSNLTLRNVTIENNHNPFGSIGGMHSFESNLLIENVTIRNNSSGNDAGGLFLDGVNQLTNVMIYNNHANYGPVVFFSGENKLNNVLIQGNVSNNGMGIYGGVSVHGNTVFNNVTMSNNISDDGNISILNGNLVLINSVIWGNEPEEIIFAGQSNPIIFTAAYSDIQGGLESIEPNDVGEINWLEGNIDLDPQFTDTTNGDFTLLPTSPCIDVGTPFFVWEGDTLVNMSENEYFGSAPDMGAYEFNPNESGISVDYLQNWNLISLPVQTDDYACNNIDESTLYGFEEGGYVNTEIVEMEMGTGYWLRFIEEETCTFSGFPINETSISLSEGWNLIGSISSPVDVNTVMDENNLIIPGTVYGFDGGYFDAETIEPGYGYWVRSSGDGEITLSSSAPLTKSRLFQTPKHLNTLTLNNTSLYFGNNIEVKNPLSYSLPPKPPLGAKDIRFSGDTKLCTSDECLIEVMNDGSPLTIECEIKDGEVWELVDESGEVFECSSVNVLDVGDESETFVLRKSTSPQTPTEFVLHPAYPNPFNPVTTIRFSVPELSEVNVSIYDMRGRLVETLVDKKLSPGNHSVQWNAMDQSSSMYFIRLARNGKSEILKVVLIK